MNKITEGKYHKDVPMEHRTPQRDKEWFRKEILAISAPSDAINSSSNPEETIRVAVFDFETTGLMEDDEAIEIAYTINTVSKKDFRLLKLEEVVDMLNEPKRKEITHEIEDLTGLSLADVKGHNIDWDRVQSDFERCDIIVAHNAKFDRGVLTRYLDQKTVDSILFGCSAQGVPWSDYGFINFKQENLILYHGADFQGHRADADVLALTWLLFKFNYFEDIVTDIKTEYVIVKAIGAPKSKKDIIKTAYRFMWPGDNVNWFWFKIMKKTDFEAIKDDFEKEFYPRKKEYEVSSISAKLRFKEPRDLL